MARTDTIKFHILSQALNGKRNTNNRVGLKSRDFGPLTVVRARAPYNPISQSFKSRSIAGHEQAPRRSSIWGFEFEWATTGYGLLEAFRTTESMCSFYYVAENTRRKLTNMLVTLNISRGRFLTDYPYGSSSYGLENSRVT